MEVIPSLKNLGVVNGNEEERLYEEIQKEFENDVRTIQARLTLVKLNMIGRATVSKVKKRALSSQYGGLAQFWSMYPLLMYICIQTGIQNQRECELVEVDVQVVHVKKYYITVRQRQG